MNKNELRLILEEGEGYKIEFKEYLTNIDREIVAFANSSGGRIFLGIADDGKITFRQSHEYLKLAKEETTQKTTQKILSAIKGKPEITREELAGLLGITPDGVKYHLDNLKKKGVIKRVGGRREGVWEILRKAES